MGKCGRHGSVSFDTDPNLSFHFTFKDPNSDPDPGLTTFDTKPGKLIRIWIYANNTEQVHLKNVFSVSFQNPPYFTSLVRGKLIFNKFTAKE